MTSFLLLPAILRASVSSRLTIAALDRRNVIKLLKDHRRGLRRVDQLRWLDEAELCCSITDRDRVSVVRVVLVADQRQWLARMQDERAKASVLSIEGSASLRD